MIQGRSILSPVREFSVTKHSISAGQTFAHRMASYQQRIERCMDESLPADDTPPSPLHQAMRYAVLNGGKRIRPLFCYATAEALGVDAAMVDAPAACIEMIHAFSLVHDDLPAMDDDDLRRGKPTAHVAFGEAVAILAGDALQMQAFHLITRSPALAGRPELQVALIDLIADAAGSLGMTGGQAMDLAAEGHRLGREDLETMFAMKTGCLIRASILSACLCAGVNEATMRDYDRYARAMGLAFQIKDDVLDEEGETAVIGKPQGSDRAHGKATYPSLFGMDDAKARCDELYYQAVEVLDRQGLDADGLRWLSAYVIKRDF
jgi:geranylgeranyl pyrophosphate synthase